MWSRYLKLVQGTASELALEAAVCKLGIPYRFQFPIWRYVVDFAFPTLKLIVEVDGSSHDTATAKAKDAERTKWLKKQGWRVVRCRNEDAVADPDGTIKKMLKGTKYAKKA